jgi:putative transcriptional regulator
VDSLAGQLLIASPALFDPNFRRMVVLIAEHGDEGAMGLVLNRPSDTTVAEGVPPLSALAGPAEPVYVGGPVEPEGVIVLAEFEDPAEAAAIVVGDVGFVPADGGEDVDVRRARVFAGHAGWTGGQLEAELEEGSWIVEPALPEDVFAREDLWETVLRRKGGAYALAAGMPLDPSLN